MRPGTRISSCDWLAMGVLALVGLALYTVCRTRYAYHWDGAQFAVAINQYDIRLSQPHAPGYFLYVMLGRLVNAGLGDPHASLVWISVVSASALAPVLYLLGTWLFDRRTGWLAGALTLTSPQVWFHGCVAATYALDAFLIATFILLAWRAMTRGGTWLDAVGLGLWLAIVAGVRLQTAPWLVPATLYVIWHFDRQRILKTAVVALVGAMTCLAWLWPMWRTCGGLTTFLEIVRLHRANYAPDMLVGGGWEAVRENVYWVAIYCWNGLMLGVVALVGALVYRVVRLTPERRHAWQNAHGRAMSLLAWWISPLVLFGTVLGFTHQPGYVLSYLPALILLAAVAITHIRSVSWRRAAAVAAVAGNVFAFLAWPPSWDGAFSKMGRTARELREHDQLMERLVRVIRERYDPSTTIVCHESSWFALGLRHFQLHLPEYDQYQLLPDPTIIHPAGRPYWRSRDGRLEYVGGMESAGKTTALLVVPPGLPAAIFGQLISSQAREVPGSNGRLYEIDIQAIKL